MATHMNKEAENQMNKCVREVFEPRYGRRLSDDEVFEISRNLLAYAKWLIKVGGRLYCKSGKLLENGNEVGIKQSVEEHSM